MRQELCASLTPSAPIAELARPVLIINEDPGRYINRADVLHDLFQAEVMAQAPYTGIGVHRADRPGDHYLMVSYKPIFTFP